MLAFASALFLLQMLSLYSTPIPDSYLWWGDESWLMLEFRNQILHGIFQHPYALGSSLLYGSGIIFGNMWVPAIVYGIPAALVSPQQMDIVLLGRSITAIFAFTLLVVLYEIARRITSDRLLALFSAFLLLASRSFLFTSHSARYDILSALAIVGGIYYLLRIHRELTIFRAAILGCTIAATMLITIHVTIALTLAALVTAIFHSHNHRPRMIAAFIGGGVIFLLFLIAISALRGGATLFGSQGSNSFALNIHDIPALRMYSRSVQAANLVQRWSMLSMYGFGYIFIFASIAVLAIVQYIRKPIPLSVSKTSVILAVVIFSWLELESSAPSSYLIYMLPVLSVVVALALKRLLGEELRTWAIACASIVLAIVAFRDVPGRHGKGYHLMTSNALAVGAALGEVEQPDSGQHPLVLAFNPAVHEVMRDTNVRLMTTQFIEYPLENVAVDSVLRSAGVNYVLLYSSALKPDYMREVGPIRAALAHIATPVWERPGYFTDIGRSYFDTTLSEPDTLRLYRVNQR